VAGAAAMIVRPNDLPTTTTTTVIMGEVVAVVATIIITIITTIVEALDHELGPIPVALHSNVDASILLIAMVSVICEIMDIGLPGVLHRFHPRITKKRPNIFACSSLPLTICPLNIFGRRGHKQRRKKIFGFRSSYMPNSLKR
jgi:hypothetical protein